MPTISPRKIYVFPVLDKGQALALCGKMVDETAIQTLIQSNADVYNADGEPLLFLRKNIVPTPTAHITFGALRSAAVLTKNRVSSTGGGSISVNKQVIASRAVRSGVIGYYDRSPRFPYCRQSAFNQKSFQKFSDAIPYIKIIDNVFRDVAPEAYKAQSEMIARTHTDFIIKGTAFTTVTVNLNYRTALHMDKGDFIGGMGTLGVLARGKYKGAYIVLPRFGIGADVRSGDVAIFNVHEIHGNTSFVGVEGRYERLSIVAYYREKMHLCGSAEEELQRVRIRKPGDSKNPTPLY